MNLKRSQRMQKLVDIETQQSQPVVAKFKADQIALQQQEQALQNLLTYREEYTEKFKAQGIRAREIRMREIGFSNMNNLDIFLEKEKFLNTKDKPHKLIKKK